MKKNIFKLPVVIIAIMLISVSVISLAMPDRELSENENRYLHQLPVMSVDSILSGDFEEDFQHYINDQLIGRETLMKLKAVIMILTGSYEINGVYITKSGRFVEAIKPWDVDADSIKNNLAAIDGFFSSCGIDKDNCSVIIVPTAGYICSGSVPSFAPIVDQKSILDEAASEIQSANVIDVSSALIKADYSQFYLTDHHWTSDAAYASYKIFRGDKESFDGYNRTTVTTDFLGTLYSKVLFYLKKDSIEIYDSGRDFSAVCDGEKKPLFNVQALLKKDKYEIFLGGNYSQVKLDGAGMGNLLIIKDSFANSFAQFAANDYAEVHMLDLRYFNGDAKQYVKDNNITEILFLYGLDTFVSDRNIIKLSDSFIK